MNTRENGDTECIRFRLDNHPAGMIHFRNNPVQNELHILLLVSQQKIAVLFFVLDGKNSYTVNQNRKTLDSGGSRINCASFSLT